MLVPSHNLFQGFSQNIKRMIKLRNLFKQDASPVVISFMSNQNILVILSALGLKKKVIICEHTDPKKYKIGRLWGVLRLLTYSLSDTLVVLSEEIKEWFKTRVTCPVVIIPNAVNVPVNLGKADDLGMKLLLPLQSRFVMAMGRFVEGKGFDLLLNAWSLIHERHSDWRLVILGDGILRPELEQLCLQLGVSASVSLPGIVKDPFEYLGQGDLFVLPSRFEGFPNALIEAMSCGLPVVAANCTGAISDIVRDGVDGLLVPVEDIPALSQAMERLMADEPLRKKMAGQAPDVTNRYGVKKVMEMWEKLIDEIMTSSKNKSILN
jgi:glycosyltransferase involved in cell wall biosynthesis